ncbi:MAG: protein-tyrosine kinase [Rikenellaceae bacterium]
MNRGSIAIENDKVTVTFVDGTVWLSQHQIASLFDVFASKISSNIRSILKNEQLRESDVCYTYRFDGGSIDLYNLEMILALAFRVGSYKAEVLRRWILEQIAVKRGDNAPIFLNFKSGAVVN